MLSEKEEEKNPYHRNHFRYNSEHNTFTCPEQKELVYKRTMFSKKRNQHSDLYVFKACTACDKQQLCTKGKYRHLNIEKREGLRNQIRERLNTIEGQVIYKKRMLIESIFGVLKHKLKYLSFYLRGTEKTTAEWQLICIGYNLKRIHKIKLS